MLDVGRLGNNMMVVGIMAAILYIIYYAIKNKSDFSGLSITNMFGRGFKKR